MNEKTCLFDYKDIVDSIMVYTQPLTLVFSIKFTKVHYDFDLMMTS